MSGSLAHYTDKDPGHDADHVRRILARLDLLAEGLPTPRVDRLYFLACFHGLGQRIGHDAGFRRQVEAFLASLGWAEPEIVEVLHSLQRHLTAPVTVEERIVHDGNAVEVLRQGIPRPFQDRSQDQGAVLGPARPDPLTDREDAYPG
jgi:hypothetical protein